MASFCKTPSAADRVWIESLIADFEQEEQEVLACVTAMYVEVFYNMSEPTCQLGAQ